MKRIGGIALALLLVLGTAVPSMALRMAIHEAVARAVKRAVAIGLRPVELESAVVGPDYVMVRILATDTEPDPGDEVMPDSGAGLA